MIDYKQGVALDRISEEHVLQLREWRNHIKVRKWCRQADLISVPEQWEWFQGLQGDSTRSMDTNLAADTPVGVCGLTSIDRQNRRAEFSLYISPQAQGQKLGERALKTLLEHGFKGLGLNLIWGECFAGNNAANLFKSIGMVEEGRRRDFYFRDGKFIDAVLYSVKAGEWNIDRRV